MKILLSLACLLLFSVACSSTKDPSTPTAAYYLQEGEKLFEKGLYEEAITMWEKARDSYYSPELNTLAEMKIAEAHFMGKNYVEAAAAYEDFLKQHPDHERTPQILYRLGLSYYEQILSLDRDQTATRNALATFQNFLKRFPNDPNAEEARTYIARCTDRLAEHELYVGRFYLRAGHYEAAVKRLEDVFVHYPDYDGRDRAFFYLGQAYLAAGDPDAAMKAFNSLFEEFPRSEHALKARKLLEKQN
jgi:outer membrane protein assembly factor BamD